jgi:Ca-activated chloride channel family protein
MMDQFHLIRPAWLWVLPLLWVLVGWLARRRAGDGDWSQLIDRELLADLRLSPATARQRRPWPWLALAWTLAVLALAGPSWQQTRTPAYRGKTAWVLVLDLSPTMAATDLAPNRYTRARYALDDLLVAAHDTRVGLVVFSDEPYTVTPLTEDVATIRVLLPPLSPDIMPSAGDNLAPALDAAGKLITQAGVKNGKIVVLSDGVSDSTVAFARAQALRAQGIAVNVVGVGTSVGGQAQNIDQLQQLATSGGGRYVDLSQLPALIPGLQSRHELSGEASTGQGVRVEHWQDGGFWLLLLLLPITALLARRGWL